MPLGPGTYNLSAVRLMIGGIRITGFSDGDVITFEHPEDLAEPIYGADGELVISGMSNNHMLVTILLLPTSRAYPLLYGELVEQWPPGEPKQIQPLDFICRDSINGETISTDNAVFLNRPAPIMGKTLGEREFRMVLKNAGENMVANVLVLT